MSLQAATGAFCTQNERRPLYLGGAGASVDARDDALLVRLRRRQSVALVPITRVDRVICDGRTDWSGRALELCLRSAVPVVLVDAQGNTAGWMEAARTTCCTADHAVERFCALADWHERYDNWLRSRRAAVLQKSFDCAGNEDASVSSRHGFKRSFVYRGVPPAGVPQIARGWMAAVTLSRLRQIGLYGRYAGYGDRILDLGADVANLLAAEFALGAGNLVEGAIGEAASLRLFEAKSSELAIAAEVHIKSFLYFVHEAALRWH